MVKSRFSIPGFWLMLAMLIFFFLFLLSNTTKFYFNTSIINLQRASPKEFRTEMMIFLPAFIVFGCYVIGNTNRISIDNIAKKITILNVITRKTKTYLFSDVEGFIDTVERSGYGGYKVIFIVKDGKFVGKISGYWYSNNDTLKEGLADLNYLGFYDFSLTTPIKILFGMKVWED